MTRQIVLRSPPQNRRQPLLNGNQSPEKDKHRIGEVAGGTAAECAAVCCCCPCALVNFLVLAVYKVPTGLCRKAWKKKMKRQRMMKKKKQEQLLNQQQNGGPTNPYDESTAEIEEPEVGGAGGSTAAAVDMEKEMWGRFYGTGFWRSPSQRDD